MGNIEIMDVKKYKKKVVALTMVIFATGMIMFLYYYCSQTIMGLINGEDYIFYTWGSIPSFFALPVMIYGDVLCLSVLLPYSMQTTPVLLKLIIPATIYAVAALVLGFMLSIIISIYPLGTNYYQCNTSGIVSGSHYAKSKGMCKAREYSANSEGKNKIQK
ncbi:uncharacterized DUF1240 family protein [Buttiauxella brennerae ATCC 51605]|uniref:Uncharacterized DUF1240 family protein n=1 Tax=Buttiauxella brennerae ATCC 51605 TaxID=1354251 RepID=A0A1B7IWP7_9ENTR|nr:MULTISPECIES: DUF1240 domain-containing protein [Buttiauxella]MCE0826417.1 DUF1240 domain-containing protein [Buttiauxella ferragutiae]OAT34389.1 uncharacterized DUF1240 family protein [Buttiauxella brennerae ATCC 51605]